MNISVSPIRWISCAIILISLSACSTFGVKERPYKGLLKTMTEADTGVGSWYYCGSDNKYHYFRVKFFLVASENRQKIRREEFKIAHVTPFKGDWKNGVLTDMLTGKPADPDDWSIEITAKTMHIHNMDDIFGPVENVPGGKRTWVRKGRKGSGEKTTTGSAGKVQKP